jgi:hypothetical protein
LPSEKTGVGQADPHGRTTHDHLRNQAWVERDKSLNPRVSAARENPAVNESHHSRDSARATFWTKLERLRVIVEILAFGAAGIWALLTFVIDKNRTYQEGGALESSIEWRRTPDGDCSGEYTVKFHNVSKIPVTIAAGKIRVWRMKKFTPNDPNETVRYVIPTALKQDLLLEQETDRFNGKYQPDEVDDEGFTFDLAKSESGPVLFELILWDEHGLKTLQREKKDVLTATDNLYARWDNNRWDWPCFESPKQTPAKSDHPGF